MKYYIKTFGCQMNTSDSERMASFLNKNGYEISKEISQADLVIFNTCGIKQTAENRAYSMINNLRKEKKQQVKIIMTGCLANRPDVQKRMKTKVDVFCEIKDFTKNMESMIHNTSYEIHDTKNFTDKENLAYLSINPKHTNTFLAYVPIMTGCNNFCTYCVVPYARGREVSRPADEILNEVKDLVSKGYKNIILLGQNVNSYASQVHKVYKVGKVHKEKIEEINFSILLKKINVIPGKFWIQFVSSHPKDMSDELIETVSKCKKVCENIHLPMQSGDDEILRKMNRKYNQKHYLQLIGKIKKNFKKYKPDALYSISSDIIVGFPGESRKQFMQSAVVMEKVKFDMVFFGQYSPRPGTAAWKMKDNVSQAEKARRENYLNEILKKTSFSNNKKYVGKTVEILIEKKMAKSEMTISGLNFYHGKTRTLKNVKISSSKDGLVGNIIKAKITKANIWNLEGVLQ